MSSLREIQLAKLEMLEEVAALCEKHDLQYTLYRSTLLGAIRRGGFMPWDDSVDIAMPLNDYRRFLKVANELPDKYVVQYPDNPPNHLATWTKVYMSGTTFMPVIASGIDKHWGVSLDIHPLIGAAKTKIGKSAQSIMLKTAYVLLNTELYRCQLENGLEGNALKRNAKRVFTSIPSPVRRITANALMKLSTIDPVKAERIGAIDNARFAGKYLRTDLDDMTVADFEGLLLRIPRNFDKMLRSMYGDYMALPHENIGQANFNQRAVIRDVNHDYREYQQELSKGRL